MSYTNHSSYLELPKSKFYQYLYKMYLWFSAFTNPLWWILDYRTKTILDVGCGQGYPMQLLKIVKPNLVATGVDLFDEYLKEAKKLAVYQKLLKADATKLPFPDKSFDTVICLQVIEHLPEDKGKQLLKELENIAKFQVIVTTPQGFCEHPDMDENDLQKHLSGWRDKDFRSLGYRIKHQGLNILFGEDGLVHKNIPKPLKGGLFFLDKLLIPVYFFLPKLSDYWIIAYKKLS